ncbi:hypothetical protein CDV36_002187 [Fusarium kuroshium]|uniref:Aminoglycoside phosphotransferase domain-containing protein n=1 Tax=Fusarium kuroshium TaxID=2010991 RepID=A0A3M2SLX5_9HYPO|nr:hypothetical protein CDV36_002187 [Fusarium kuroshium]
MPSQPASSGDGYLEDDCPLMPDGSEWNGLNLLDLLKRDRSPFSPTCDVNLLLQEVEEKLGAKVIDVPRVYNRAGNYDINLILSDQRRVLARLANADVNMPNYGGTPLDWLHKDLDFEVAIYGLLQNAPGIPTDRLLHYRYPLQHTEVKHGMPKDITGRWLMIFEIAQGERQLWFDLDQRQRMSTLANAAKIHAALLKLELPRKFVNEWLLSRNLQSVELIPRELPHATRDFWVAIFKVKVERIIGNEGDKIGWSNGEETVGPKALAAKKSLLRLIPLILLEGNEAVLYRPVLQHNNFSADNILNLVCETGETSITSVFGWEAGTIVPLILSEVMFVNGFLLTIDAHGKPATLPLSSNLSRPEEWDKNEKYNAEFLKEVKRQAPELEDAIRKAKHARYIWMKLRHWSGKRPEEFFGRLGDWVEDFMERGMK